MQKELKRRLPLSEHDDHISNTKSLKDFFFSVAALSDTVLLQHVREFSRGILDYQDIFRISTPDLEYLRKQLVAFSWIVDVAAKLEKYSEEVGVLRDKIKMSHIDRKLGLLGFFDLPRPPVFYFEGDIISRFSKLVSKVRNSPQYNTEIGRDLGIDQL